MAIRETAEERHEQFRLSPAVQTAMSPHPDATIIAGDKLAGTHEVEVMYGCRLGRHLAGWTEKITPRAPAGLRIGPLWVTD